MPRRGPRYQRNPRLRFSGWGRRKQDENCGAWSYENKLVTDEFGRLVDPSFGTYDRDYRPKDGDRGRP